MLSFAIEETEVATDDLVAQVPFCPAGALIPGVKDYAIYMLSADGTVISWNEGARRAKGYLSDEIIGRYFGLFYSEAERSASL